MKSDSLVDGSGKENDLKSSVKDQLIRALVYLLAAAGVYSFARLNWWIGLVCFIVFVFCALLELLISGFFAILEIFVSLISFRLMRLRGINLNRIDELKQPVVSLLKTNLVIASFEIYLIAVTVLLAGTLYLGWFALI